MAHKSLQPIFGHELRRQDQLRKIFPSKAFNAKNTLCRVLSVEADHLGSLVLFAVNIHLNRHSAHTLNNFHHLVFVESNSVHVLIDLYGHMLSDNAVFTMFQSL